ncbi:MAG: glycosyltransferase family 2 protein [Flavobacteriales bacterium]
MIALKMISILMPVKNVVQYLKECLDSILTQTETFWELIAINDGSTDESFKILNDYATQDSRIKIYNNRGVGIIEALQLAYSKSNGNLITRMDADDIMKKDKLHILKKNLLKKGKGHIALGLVSYFSEQPLGDGFKKYETWLNRLSSSGINFSEIYKECVIPSPCWMVYREDLDSCKAFKPNDYPEDYDLAFRFYLKGLQPIACKKVLHLWRDYPTRTSRTDEHYADNTFLEIKLRYFLKLEYNHTKKLVVWGAGAKGKSIAKKLLAKEIDFLWICDNPKKIGKHIYNQQMLDYKTLKSLNHTQSIITVANPKAQNEISYYFSNLKLLPMKDYFFFC